jgi:hypothetical protein
MSAVTHEVVEHMLLACDLPSQSVLLRDQRDAAKFRHWCQYSPLARRILQDRQGDLTTFPLDGHEGVYCLTISASTLSGIVTDLVRAYEDWTLGRLLGQR